MINANTFPFGLIENYDLMNLNYSDCMKDLKNLPTYDIIDAARNFDSLNNYDIDENIVLNLNTRYYSAHEFQSFYHLSF